MGIRFWCPNGHKLNVKTFQAGRRGICPYCGAKFQIPTESTRQPGAKDLAFEPQEHSVHEGGGGTPPGAAPVAQPPGHGPAAADAGGGGSSAGTAFPVQEGPAPLFSGEPPGATGSPAPAPGAGPAHDGPAVPLQGLEGLAPAGPSGGPAAGAPPAGAGQGGYTSAPVAPASPGAAPAPSDPLSQAPDVVWYVRPPTGGQFGPATGDVMRNWIAEGRVSPDSLVWREGWRDWQEASGVFDQLGAGEPDFPAAGLLTQPAGTQASARAAPRRHQSTTTSIIIISVLVLAVIILLGVFLYVAFGTRSEKTEGSRPRGATAISLAEHEAAHEATGSLGQTAAKHAW